MQDIYSQEIKFEGTEHMNAMRADAFVAELDGPGGRRFQLDVGESGEYEMPAYGWSWFDDLADNDWVDYGYGDTFAAAAWQAWQRLRRAMVNLETYGAMHTVGCFQCGWNEYGAEAMNEIFRHGSYESQQRRMPQRVIVREFVTNVPADPTTAYALECGHGAI